MPFRTSNLVSAALVTMSAGLSSCLFSPPVELEPDEENHPPMISTDFLEPVNNPVSIARSGPKLSFSIKQVFDVNPNEAIEILWYSPEARRGAGAILKTEQAGPEPNDATKHRKIFHRYTGSSYTLDPCDLIWSGDDRFTLSVFVADGNLTFPQDKPVLGRTEDDFVDVYTWSIEFSDECPAL